MRNIRLADVTVVVPTKNERTNIVPFLRSLPSEVEAVLVDASEDGTPGVALEARPERTRVVQCRANIPAARNIGAQVAGTRYVLYTDADVAFAPGFFDALQRRAHTDALYGLKRTGGAHALYDACFVQGQRLLDRMGIQAVSGSNLLVARQILQRIGGFDERLNCNEDTEIGWRIARAGYTIRLAEELVVYETDHRRLERGAMRKMAHSVVRCTLLYLNLMPGRLRSSDWGYWSDT